MMKFLVFFAFLANVLAFAPIAPVSRMSALKMGFENEVGVQPPLGLWDPLGLLKSGDQETFQKLRKYENKHGRIAMMAILGHIVTAAGVRAPGDVAFGIPFSTVKGGLGAFDTIPAAGIAQIILFIGLIEFGFEYQEKNIADYCKNYAKDLGWKDSDFRRREAVEINNGRAAQMGIMGLIFHEKVFGDAYVINSLLGSHVTL